MRVRNHAKMVDVYLATFNSKKGLLGNAKSVAEDIIQNPQNYHIYDGISTMTNISRYLKNKSISRKLLCILREIENTILLINENTLNIAGNL